MGLPGVIVFLCVFWEENKCFQLLESPILEASEKCTGVFKYVPPVSYRVGRNLSDMLCIKRMPPQTNANKENPNRNDHNKKEDEPQLKPSQCPECGLALKKRKRSKNPPHLQT